MGQKGILIVITVMVLLIIVIGILSNSVINEVQEVGLKNILLPIWEGAGG